MRIVIRTVLILVVFGLSLQLVSCQLRPSQKDHELAVYPEGIAGAPQVRILVRDQLLQTTLTVDGPYEILAEPPDPSQPRLGFASGPVTVVVKPTIEGFILGDPSARAPYARICIKGLGGTKIEVDGKDYGREIILLRELPSENNAKPFLRVIARVDIESYLTGVVPNEMYAHWQVEALRSQCVASRTYALYKIETRKNHGFDLRNTTASQVWEPEATHNPLINMVVNSTRGIVMSDAYRLFPAYFSSQCGGETKDGADVFISRHINPLTGVTCPYCRSQARAWNLTLSLGEIQNRLVQRGYKIGRVTGLKALDNLGRPITDITRVYDITVEHDGVGKLKTIPALRFRSAIGTGTGGIASTFFSVSVTGDTATFTGLGNGHGVGMCQYGAQLLASQGKSYREILAHYYTGHTLVKLW
ncbi:MAG: SpoIID/LytB domain-containing protein [Planctomycetes bacterium]|nr:SpoIID/LytB domain-containing protein [Planctomycetota bacterium]